MMTGTTGTGLDRLIKLIQSDEGLAARIPQSEIDAGSAAADRMNQIIIEGIQALGLANDGTFTASDVRDLSDWVAAEYRDEFTTLHGDDEGDTETGFHLIQNDGDAIKLYGRDVVDTVADGLYHLVFGYNGNNIINEDGNRNAELDQIAWWLNELLEVELIAAAGGTGPLANANIDPKSVTGSGTGLDQLADIILNDPGLLDRIKTSEIQEGAQAGADIGTMIADIIKTEGLANDGEITPSDIYQINEVIRSDAALLKRFIDLHGDDEKNAETGFHLVQNDGAKTRLYDTNAVDTVADGVYHIGFEIKNGRFKNEDGNANASVSTVAAWVDNLLRADLANGSLANPSADPVPDGTTGTGLDQLIEIIEDDIGLNRKISLSDIAGGAAAANTMNALLLEGIRATGAANDGVIQTSDMRDVNAWLRADPARFEAFRNAHGDDEDNEETGFHRVQNDGAVSRLYGENAVNTIADGIYHFGFEIKNDRFLNEDGNANQSVEKVAAWVNELLSDADLAGLANPSVVTEVLGTTGTGLDRIVEIIAQDPGLIDEIATSEIVEGAQAADALNALILEGLKAVGAGQSGVINKADVEAVNAWIRSDATRLETFTALHGDDADNVETGFHLVQNDGADTHLFDRNAVNQIADGIYHIGFEIKNGRFLNEDGNANASVSSVSAWLTGLLAEDLKNGVFYSAAADPDQVDLAAVNSGLVRQVDQVVVDGASGYQVLEHGPDLNLAQATMMFSVTPDTLEGTQGLFSKDGSGFQDGGHVTMLRSNNDLHVRVQTETGEDKLYAHNIFEVGEARHVALTLDGTTARLYVDGALIDAEDTTANWTKADEAIVLGANAWAQKDNNDDSVRQVFDGTLEDIRVYDSALSTVEIQAVSGVRPAMLTPVGPEARGPLPVGTTGTGLDDLVRIITEDVGLDRRIPDAEIAEGARAADVMNGLIIEALQATGVANDGTLTAGDIRDLSDWIMENRKAAFIEAHGDDEGESETGFHLVQNDGAKTRIFGDNAVDTVADGLYHLPFGYRKDRIINEDGNNNQKLEDLAWWLEALLVDEMAAAVNGTGPLYNANVSPTDVPLTGTGLDEIVDIIFSDPGIAKNVATSDAAEAATAATGISQMIVDAIRAQGLADDGDITASDIYAINSVIRSDPQLLQRFVELHGDDEKDSETGYHLVQNDGGETRLFGDNALNTVADGVFHIGFEISKGRFRNEDGNNNASVERVAYWVNELLAEDLENGSLASGLPQVSGTTGTGLDQMIDIIMNDPGLERRISELEMREGALAGNAINEMIVDAIVGTGVAKNGEIKASDVYEINRYIRDNHYDAFVAAHGDDENNTETGFHLVQNDGATTRIYSDNAVNTVADGLFHLGFEISQGRLLNEDGNKNASVHTVAGWLDSLLTEADYARLAAQATVNPYVMGTTGTGLDQIVNLITEDDGLANRISTADIKGGAEAAQGMNEIIVAAIRATGVANDGAISSFDVMAVNNHIRSDAALLARFTELHGDDEKNAETGFHLVQNDGARTELFDKNAVNTVADGLYHIGFEVQNGRFLNEDGNKNASVSTVATWLDALLEEDLASGNLINADLLPEAVDLAELRSAEAYRLPSALEVTKSGGTFEIAAADTIDFGFVEGTVIVDITPQNAEGAGRDTFFSRDGINYQDGGHLTMWVERGDLFARFQTDRDQVVLRSDDVIENGQSYQVAFTFDGTVAELYLDGSLVDVEASTATWQNADEAILFGGSLRRRTDGEEQMEDLFEGSVDAAYLFDEALDFAGIQAVASPDYLLLA